MADPLPVVPARENLRTVVESNTIGGRVSGDETVSIDSLFGDISTSQRAQDTVADIMSQMSGPKGYVERLIVDQDGKVIEGAHRLEALRRLGISEVPITRIVDPTANLDLSSMRKAIEGAGKIPSDHVNQIMSQVGEMLTSTGNSPEKVLEEYTFPEGYEKYFGAALDSVADEPPPTDQPRLPLLLPPPGEPGKKPSKGSIFRGIGSLMRRRIFPLIQAAQAGWGGLSPEARAEVEAFLERPAHELVGMDKPGIEYFKEWLGISPEDLGETPSEAIPLSDLQKYIATYHGDLSSGIGSIELVGGTGRSIKAAGELSKGGQKHRVAKLKKELGSLIGTPVKGRTNTIKVSKAVDKARKTMTELEQRRMDGLIGDIDDLRDSIGPHPYFADSRGDPSLIDPPADLFQAVDKLGATVRARGGDTVPTAYERLASASPNEIKFINEALKQRFGKGLLEFDIPQFGRRDLLLLGPSPEALLRTKLRLILRKDWQGKASGGMVSKPLYEEARVGGLI